LGYLDDFKKRVNLRGKTIIDSHVKSTTSYLAKHFKDSPSYQEVYINDSTALTGVHILDDSKDREQKRIISITEPLTKGQTIKWGNTYWIVLIVDELVTYWRGYIRKCESSLKWLDSHGIIKETPFTLKLNPSIYPLDRDKFMILPAEQRVIIVQSNNDTKTIKKADRFIFDERAWKVIGVNGYQEGLIELTLEEDLINPAVDNVELRICNYYGNVANYTVSILNGDTANLSMGDTLQLIVRVMNNQSVIPSTLLTFYSSDESIAVVDQTGIITPLKKGTVIITAEYENVQDSIQINITEQLANNYTLEIIGAAEIKKGRTQTYSVRFYNNGKEIFDHAVFSLTSDDGTTPTQLATIESTNSNSCIIRAGDQIGYIQLHVKNNNGLIYGVKDIRIKPLY
jgi:Bacterial Ig-like domain (group 2)